MATMPVLEAERNRPEAAPIRISAVLASFNRREETLACLSGLFAQATPRLQVSAYLLDDGSTDGTAEAVAERFPQATVLRGSGNRYWSGGMADAMGAAIAAGTFDFILLLNDDVELLPDALERIVDAHDRAIREGGEGSHIIVGAFADPETGSLTYSGFIRPNRFFPARLERVPPRPDRLVACDTMNGNCVLVPAAVVRQLGTIDPVFVHQLGDLDYGFRAVKAGARIWIAPGMMGYCAIGVRRRAWIEPGLSIRERWRLINHPKGWPLIPGAHYMWRHGGVVGLLTLAGSYAKGLLGIGGRSPSR